MKLVKNGKLYKKFGKKDKYETLTWNYLWIFFLFVYNLFFNLLLSWIYFFIQLLFYNLVILLWICFKPIF
jgi:hypothetical protein